MRTLLTALGTILGVGAFVATNGLAETARAQVSSRFDALKATEVWVGGTDGDFEAVPDDARARLEPLNGVEHAGIYFPITSLGAESIRSLPDARHESISGIGVVAADPGAVLASRPTVRTGRLYDESHENRGERVALLGPAAATRLGVARIDNHPAVFIGDQAYTIVGILDDVERNPELLGSVIVPVSTADRALPTAGVDRRVLISTHPGAAQLIGHQAPLALRPEAPERLVAFVPPDPQSLRNDVEGDVAGLFYALSALALLIGVVAIANATLLSVIERRNEIGLRRALGARRSHIRRQITIEAGSLGLLAGVVGANLGLVGVVIVSAIRGWTTTIEPLTLIAAPVVGLLAGTVAGLLPALRAARTPPATALRQ